MSPFLCKHRHRYKCWYSHITRLDSLYSVTSALKKVFFFCFNCYFKTENVSYIFYKKGTIDIQNSHDIHPHQMFHPRLNNSVYFLPNGIVDVRKESNKLNLFRMCVYIQLMRNYRKKFILITPVSKQPKKLYKKTRLYNNTAMLCCFSTAVLNNEWLSLSLWCVDKDLGCDKFWWNEKSKKL
jgi:hypothetical protein